MRKQRVVVFLSADLTSQGHFSDMRAEYEENLLMLKRILDDFCLGD